MTAALARVDFLAPAISLPYGSDARGRPIGLRLIGRRFEDAALLSLAAAVEDRTEA